MFNKEEELTLFMLGWEQKPISRYIETKAIADSYFIKGEERLFQTPRKGSNYRYHTKKNNGTYNTPKLICWDAEIMIDYLVKHSDD